MVFFRFRPRMVGLVTDVDLGCWRFSRDVDLGWWEFSYRCRPRMVRFSTDIDLGWWGFLQI